MKSFSLSLSCFARELPYIDGETKVTKERQSGELSEHPLELRNLVTRQVKMGASD